MLMFHSLDSIEFSCNGIKIMSGDTPWRFNFSKILWIRYDPKTMTLSIECRGTMADHRFQATIPATDLPKSSEVVMVNWNS